MEQFRADDEEVESDEWKKGQSRDGQMAVYLSVTPSLGTYNIRYTQQKPFTSFVNVYKRVLEFAT